MYKRTAYEFWNDVRDALNEYFENDNCFWSIETYMTTDDGCQGAAIDIEIDYDDVPEYYDDIFCEVENAVDNCGWSFSADWDGNTYKVVLWDDDDDDDDDDDE